jgi:hypothetical protein
MAITVDATVGGAAANSFASLDEFGAYVDGRLNSAAFTDANPNTQNQALVEATRTLSHLGWKGERVTGTQALAWPRQWALDPDSPIADYYATTVVPQRVKDATCELALAFLKAGTTDVAALDPTRNVKRKKTDVIETEYFEPQQRALGLALYPEVVRYIAPLLASSSKRTVRT